VVYFPPVKEVKTSDGVSKQLKGADGGAGVGSHGFGMRVLVEVMLDIDAKISDRVGLSHREDPAAWKP